MALDTSGVLSLYHYTANLSADEFLQEQEKGLADGYWLGVCSYRYCPISCPVHRSRRQKRPFSEWPTIHPKPPLADARACGSSSGGGSGERRGARFLRRCWWRVSYFPSAGVWCLDW